MGSNGAGSCILDWKQQPAVLYAAMPAMLSYACVHSIVSLSFNSVAQSDAISDTSHSSSSGVPRRQPSRLLCCFVTSPILTHASDTAAAAAVRCNVHRIAQQQQQQQLTAVRAMRCDAMRVCVRLRSITEQASQAAFSRCAIEAAIFAHCRRRPITRGCVRPSMSLSVRAKC